MKKQKGITLIALVLTIIILIILAAVSVNLVLGENGIMQRAQSGTKDYNIKAAQESMEMKIAAADMKYGGRATLQQLADELCEDEEVEYVELASQVASLDKVNIGEATEIYTKLIAYELEFEINRENKIESIEETGSLTPKIRGVKAVGYDGEYDGNPHSIEVTTRTEGVTITYSTDGTTYTSTNPSYTEIGEYTVYYKLEKADCDTVTGSKTVKIVKPVSQLKTLTEVIETTNYGDKVNYSVEVNGVTLNNWKIFYKDENTNEVIMIYNNYLPNSTEIAKSAGLATSGTYNLHSNINREDLINKLKDESNWSSLIRSDLEGRATAKGAVDLETWVNSWNEKGYQTLYTAKKTGINDNIGWGYYIGTSANPKSTYLSVSGNAGYNDTLYFPYKSSKSSCSAYWLASPCASGNYTLMGVQYEGAVRNCDSANAAAGVRPVVYLNSSVLTSGQDASGAWNIE